MARNSRTVGRVKIAFSADLKGPWELTHDDFPGLVFLVEVATGGDVRSITIKSTKDAPALSARTLHRVPLGELRGVVNAEVAIRLALLMQPVRQPLRMPGLPDHVTNPNVRAELDAWTKAWKRKPHTGPKGRDDTGYAQVAKAYTECLGDPKPIHALAKQLHLSTAQARNLVYEARKRGLLTAGPKGRAGGVLTPKAEQLLAEGPK